MTQNPQIQVRHNEGQKRFEAQAGDRLAYLSYSPESNYVSFDHTFVPVELRGQGVAAVLVRAALAEARERRWKVHARCSYVAAYVERHREFDDIICSGTDKDAGAGG